MSSICRPGALERLRGERYRLLVLPFADVGAASGKMQAIARASGLDGIVLAPPLCDDAVTVAELEACGLPYARIAPTTDGSQAPDVAMDDRAATRAVIDHLVELGHKRIGIVRGDPSHASTAARLEAYRAGLKAHGLKSDAKMEAQGANTFVSGYEAGKVLLALADRPTAIFASNDDMAAGVLNAAYEAGVKGAGRTLRGGLRRQQYRIGGMAAAHDHPPADPRHGARGDRRAARADRA